MAEKNYYTQKNLGLKIWDRFFLLLLFNLCQVQFQLAIAITIELMKTAKMEDDKIGRRQKWKNILMEDDQRGKLLKWKKTEMKDD